MQAQPVLTAGSWRTWVAAIRVPTLSAAVVPVLVGSAVAIRAGAFRPMRFGAALLAAILIQVGTNLVNDLADFQKGADTSTRQGPVRVVQAGLLTQRQVMIASVLAFAGAVMLGLYLVVVGGWPILLAGLITIAAGILYTAGPWPLGYHGLGDLTCFFCFGLVAVLGTFYLHTGYIDGLAVAASIPVAMLVTAILVVNNLRDLETDRLAGKHTLAVMLGARGTQLEYTLLVGGAYLIALGLWLSGAVAAWALLPWLTLVLGWQLIGEVWRARGAALNCTLRGTSKLHLLFGILLAASFIL